MSTRNCRSVDLQTLPNFWQRTRLPLQFLHHDATHLIRYYTGTQPALNHVGARDVGPTDRTKWVQTVTVGASNRQTTSYSIKI